MNRGLTAAALAASLCISSAAFAEDSGSPFSVFKGMFNPKSSSAGPQTSGQDEATPDQVMRIEHLEAQIRQMTGTIEELRYRNQQLEAQLRGLGVAPNSGTVQSQPMRPPGPATSVQGSMQPTPGYVPGSVPAPAPGPAPSVIAAAPPPPPAPEGPGGRRDDAFNPALHPGAPGAPHALGSPQNEPPPVVTANAPIGAPGGRQAGGPLDLSTLASREAAVPGAAAVPSGSGALPPPPPRNFSATGAVASVSPPSDTPKDYYDLAYGYVLRKDYTLAEQNFRVFLQKFPTDRRASDAQYWLGESLFQRQRYDAAAQAFLDLSTKHATSPKAPEALLRLAQSLEAMKQKEMACATLAEVGRKYPKAPQNVKQGVEREQKRGHC